MPGVRGRAMQVAGPSASGPATDLLNRGCWARFRIVSRTAPGISLSDRSDSPAQQKLAGADKSLTWLDIAMRRSKTIFAKRIFIENSGNRGQKFLSPSF
jgi:hypothetical protein